MNYITFNEIIEVNGLLEEKGLNFKVHLRDACGKAVMLDRTVRETVHAKDGMRRCIRLWRSIFRRKGQKIAFDETKLNFLLFNAILWVTPHKNKTLFHMSGGKRYEFNSGIVICVWLKVVAEALTFRLFVHFRYHNGYGSAVESLQHAIPTE